MLWINFYLWFTALYKVIDWLKDVVFIGLLLLHAHLWDAQYAVALSLLSGDIDHAE